MKALHVYLDAWRDREFAPGTADCAQFVRGWVRERLNRDLGAGYVYGTIEEGLAELRSHGLRDHIALAARHLPEIHPAMAQPGDLAAVPTDEGPALAIVGGEYVYAVGPRGLSVMPRTRATRAFACRR